VKHLILILFALLSANVMAADLQITGTVPTLRVDGQPITGVLTYTLYTSIDNVVQPPVSLTSPVYTISNIVPGAYTVQLSASEDGLMGPVSDPVTKIISPLAAAAPGKVVITVDMTGCGAGCGVQIQ